MTLWIADVFYAIIFPDDYSSDNRRNNVFKKDKNRVLYGAYCRIN